MLSFQTQRECIEHMRMLIEEARQHPNLMPVLPTKVQIQGCSYQVEITPDHKIILYSDWDPDNNRPDDSSESQDVTTEKTHQTLQDLQITTTGTSAITFSEYAKSEEACNVVPLPRCSQERADIDQARASSTISKHRERHFPDLGRFKAYVKQVFDDAQTPNQAELQTTGNCIIDRFKLHISWKGKQPHVVLTPKRHFLKIEQLNICKQVEKILTHAMHERFPDTPPEQEGATGYQ